MAMTQEVSTAFESRRSVRSAPWTVVAREKIQRKWRTGQTLGFVLLSCAGLWAAIGCFCRFAFR